jgi:hypothetical protein
MPAGSKAPAADAIIDAGCRGRSLVRQILTRRRGTRIKRLGLWPVVSEVRDLLAGITPENVIIRLEVDDPHAAVLADATHLHQPR